MQFHLKGTKLWCKVNYDKDKQHVKNIDGRPVKDTSKDMIAIAPRRVITEDLTRERPVVSMNSVEIGGIVRDQSLLLGMSSLQSSQLQEGTVQVRRPDSR